MKIKSFSSFSIVCIGLILFGLGWAPGASPLMAQEVVVEQAIPDNAPQGTISLNVQVKGKGFKKGATAQWFVTGTTNPGGVTVNSTTFVSSSELVANISVAADAQTELKFDIVVTLSSGRTGKGIELFSVTAEGSSDACVAPTPVLAAPAPDCYLTAAGCLDITFGTNGLVITNTSGGEPLDTDIDIANGVAIQADGKIVAAGDALNPDASTREEDFTIVRYNSDGTLDTAFGTGGIVRVPIPGTQWAEAVAIQPDGKIVVAGGYTDFQIVRLNPNGTLDGSFGNGGIATVSFTTRKGKGNQAGGRARDLALQPDGKIIVVGGGSSNVTWPIARLNSDGGLDSSFGNGGKVQAEAGGGSAYAVVVQPVQVGTTTELRILVGGDVAGFSSDPRDFALMRFTPSGSLDTSFGPSATGVTQTDFCKEQDRVYELALDGAGNIVAGGFAGFGGLARFGIARYSGNGALDTSFGDPQLTASGQPTGKTVISFMGLDDNNYGLVVQPDGKPILVGGVCNPDCTGGYFGLARLNTDGTLDTTFGTGGVVTTDFGAGSNEARKAVLTGDGKIVVVGSAVADGGNNFAVARYWP